MKNLITGVVLSVAAHGAVLYPLALQADEACEASVRTSAIQEYRAARASFVRMVAAGTRNQLAALNHIAHAFTVEEKMFLVSVPDGGVIPDALAAKVARFEEEHFSVLCLHGEEAMDGDAGWKCVGEADTYTDAPYPIVLQELIFEAGMVYACTEYVTRDGAAPEVDAYACSVIDFESGEVFGRRALDTIDRDEVSPEVFAYVRDVPLHESLEAYVTARISEECHQ